MSNVAAFEQYPFRIEPLPADEGGGFVIRFPDLPGCLSDGDSVEEAIANGREAFEAWIEAQIEDGKPVPRPNEGGEPAKFVQRLPKYLHARLMERAAQEGVSMNSLVTAFVVEGLATSEPYRRTETPVAGVQDRPRRDRGRGEGAVNMGKKGVHTVPNAGGRGWVNKVGGEVESRHRTKETAVKRGREIARANRTEHAIHDKDGQISQKNSYGNDPNPPKDKR